MNREATEFHFTNYATRNKFRLLAMVVTNQIAPSPPAAAAADGLREIKPPVEISSGWEWLWWGLGALVLAALFYLAWRYWRNRKAQIPVAPPVPAHVRAKQKLQEALALVSQPKPFVILVSDTIRSYLEERFDFRAPERTTEEFLHELQGTTLLTPEQKEKLGEFLERCDLVKFAKYEPLETELRELHASAVRLVEETEPRPAPAAEAAKPLENPQLEAAKP